jgi:CHAT domain-containing protein
MGAPAATVTADSAAELLSELMTLPAVERLARLHAEDDAETVLIALAEACDRMAASEVAAALAAGDILIALAEALGSPRARSATHRSRAAVLSYAGDYGASLWHSAEAATIADSWGFVTEAARARLAAMQPMAQLGRYDEAIAAGEAARAALVAAGELSLAARADVSIGAVHDMRDDHARALTHYDRALPLLRDDLMMVAQLESNRGIALMGLDQFAVAERAFQSSVEAFASLGLDWAAAIAEGNLAYMATRQGRLERAMHHFERARRCVEADESPGDLARLLAEQAEALAALGMPAEAARTYERALPSLETHGLALEAAEARAGLGYAQIRLGRFDEAEATLDDAAQRFDRLGQDVPRARLDLTRSELAAKRGRRDDARLLAADALDVLSGRPSDAAMARARLAGLDLDLGDVEDAAAQIAAALPTAERLDLVPLRARLLHLRGRAARERGDPGKALADFRAAIEQVERVRGTLQAERFRTGFLGDHLGVYDDAVLAALDQNPPDVATAFATVEHAKSRALLDLVAGTIDLVEAAGRDAADEAEARLLAELARVRAALNWYYGGANDGGRADEPPAAETRRRAIQALEHELSDLEDRLAATKGVAGLFAPPIDIEATLRLVPAGAALIEYYAAGSEVLAFVLHGGKASVVRRLAASGDVAERVRRLQFQIGRAVASAGRAASPDRAARLLADAQRELRALFELLIAPLQTEIANATRLIVVPHGALHAIPFGALWDGERYVIERREIVVVPSASVFAQVKARQPATDSGGALVVGVPDELAPRIAAEAEEVGAVLDARPILASAATVDRVRGAAPNARIVHLACHGRFDAANPMASGLKLADRWLTVRDVYGLRLNGPLVTLSGCETGKAAVGSGDELLGLVRAFFAAGASSLLLSLWVADDEGTTSMMGDFYRALREGTSPAAALRAAQCAHLARQPHPAFWAPFVLGGYA